MKAKSILHKIQAARERGKRMAAVRWRKDRERRAALEAAEKRNPLRAVGKIVRRVVVIDHESVVKEIIRRGG